MELAYRAKQAEECRIYNFKASKKLKKDGTPKRTRCNSVEGKAHTVYPLKTKEEIMMMKQYFTSKIENGERDFHKEVWEKHLLCFNLGLNVALRAGDLLKLTWGDVLTDNLEVKDFYRIKEQKTKNYRDLYFNTGFKSYVTNYVLSHKEEIKLNDYLFPSSQGGHIEVKSLNKVLKQAAKECNIKVNIGTHSLRKTWAYQQLMAHKNDAMFLSVIQEMLGHSTPQITLRYAGIEGEWVKQYYEDVIL